MPSIVLAAARPPAGAAGDAGTPLARSPVGTIAGALFTSGGAENSNNVWFGEGARAGGAGVFLTSELVGAATTAPHDPQNFTPSAIGSPHCLQTVGGMMSRNIVRTAAFSSS
jgi:hypothetical protein